MSLKYYFFSLFLALIFVIKALLAEGVDKIKSTVIKSDFYVLVCLPGIGERKALDILLKE